jgi:hypothetical protein
LDFKGETKSGSRSSEDAQSGKWQGKGKKKDKEKTKTFGKNS